MFCVQGQRWVGPGAGGNRQMKLRIFRIAVALSSLAALISSVGADAKWN